jgi:uncharacterized membrane protein YecN with MAPEG domain
LKSQRASGGETKMTVTMPWVSALTAGVLLILQTLLMLSAANTRRTTRSPGSDGDAANPHLHRRVRRHGNLAENAAIFVVAFTLLELLGEKTLYMEVICGVFLLARLFHALGFTLRNTVNIFRLLGVVLTVAVGLVAGGRLVWMAVGHLCLPF